MDDSNNNLQPSTINNNFNIQQPLIIQQNKPEILPQSNNLELPMEFNNYPMPNRKDSMSHRCLD